MAQITGLLEMQKALKDIEQLLKSLAPLNAFLNTPNATNEYTISFDKTKATLLCNDKSAVDIFVKAKKDSIVSEINSLAQKYSITLDDEDKKIMNEFYVPNQR